MTKQELAKHRWKTAIKYAVKEAQSHHSAHTGSSAVFEDNPMMLGTPEAEHPMGSLNRHGSGGLVIYNVEPLAFDRFVVDHGSERIDSLTLRWDRASSVTKRRGDSTVNRQRGLSNSVRSAKKEDSNRSVRNF